MTYESATAFCWMEKSGRFAAGIQPLGTSPQKQTMERNESFRSTVKLSNCQIHQAGKRRGFEEVTQGNFLEGAERA